MEHVELLFRCCCCFASRKVTISSAMVRRKINGGVESVWAEEKNYFYCIYFYLLFSQNNKQKCFMDARDLLKIADAFGNFLLRNVFFFLLNVHKGDAGRSYFISKFEINLSRSWVHSFEAIFFLGKKELGISPAVFYGNILKVYCDI